jgi:hypothetical protein
MVKGVRRHQNKDDPLCKSGTAQRTVMKDHWSNRDSGRIKLQEEPEEEECSEGDN